MHLFESSSFYRRHRLCTVKSTNVSSHTDATWTQLGSAPTRVHTHACRQVHQWWTQLQLVRVIIFYNNNKSENTHCIPTVRSQLGQCRFTQLLLMSADSIRKCTAKQKLVTFLINSISKEILNNTKVNKCFLEAATFSLVNSWQYLMQNCDSCQIWRLCPSEEESNGLQISPLHFAFTSRRRQLFTLVSQYTWLIQPEHW